MIRSGLDSGTARVEKNPDLKKKKNRIFLFKSDFFYLIFLKYGIHNVIKYFIIRLSGVNTATQVCALYLCFCVKKHKTLLISMLVNNYLC